MIYFWLTRRLRGVIQAEELGDSARFHDSARMDIPQDIWIDGRGLSIDALVSGLSGSGAIGEGNGQHGQVLGEGSNDSGMDRADALRFMAGQIGTWKIPTSCGMISLAELFEIEIREAENAGSVLGGEYVFILAGDNRRVDGLCAGTSMGTTLVFGDVGDQFGAGQRGGTLVLMGNAGDDALSDKRDGLSFIVGSVGDRFASPAPGALSGMRGGDSFVFGPVGDRACERMRRGSVFFVGNVGDYLAHRWIAGTIYVDGRMGRHWCAGMRRGSLLLRQEQHQNSGGTLTLSRHCELSFLPILWKYVRGLVGPWMNLDFRRELSGEEPIECMNWDSLVSDRADGLRHALARFLDRLPDGPKAVRCFGDVECEGQGEILRFCEVQGRAFSGSAIDPI